MPTTSQPEQRLESTEPAGELFAIPRVIERPLGLEEGPRVQVRAFKLVGAIDRPGVSVGAAQGLLDKAREGQPAEGFTINQLQEVANQVTRYYRDSGLILAQAFVPAQEVQAGEVVIQVLEGKLGAVRVEGNKSYNAAVLMKPFSSLIGAPVMKDQVEQSLLRISDYAGLSAFGVFSAGADVGTTDLVLRVQNEDRVGFDVSADNHGSRFTGEYRGQVGVTFNNALGMADRLRIYALQAFDPDDSDAKGLYGGMRLDIPSTARSSLALAVSRNAYDVGQNVAALGLTGDTTVGSLGWQFQLARSRFGSTGIGLDFARKQAKFETAGNLTNEDNLSVLSGELHFNQIGVRSRGVNQVTLRYSQGFAGLFGALERPEDQEAGEALPSRRGASGDFEKITLDVQRLQRVSANTSILLRGFGQQSEDLLTSLEQLSLGGADSVRAYPTSEFLVDRGGYASIEFIANAPGFSGRPAFGDRTWGQVLQVSLFADYAGGRLLGLTTAGVDASPEISGWGAGVQFNLPGKAFIRADIATPMTDIESSNNRDPQYYLRFAVTF